MKYISIREYARRRGCSDTAVHKAIRAGHIQESALKKDRSGKNKGINEELANEQWSATFKPSIGKNQKLATEFEQIRRDPEIDHNSEIPTGNSAPTVAKAQQVEAVYKAKLRELDYKKKSGELINKDATYRALFAIGQEIRSSLQAIPDRIIDEVLAAPTRNDAHIVLTREIHDVLSRLVTIEKTGLLEGL